MVSKVISTCINNEYGKDCTHSGAGAATRCEAPELVAYLQGSVGQSTACAVGALAVQLCLYRH
jgi:hypothetical protein